MTVCLGSSDFASIFQILHLHLQQIASNHLYLQPGMELNHLSNLIVKISKETSASLAAIAIFNVSMLFSLVISFILTDIIQFSRFSSIFVNLSGLKLHQIRRARASFENIEKSWPTKRLRLHFLGQLNAVILRIFHFVQIKSFNFIEIKLEYIFLKHFQYHT